MSPALPVAVEDWRRGGMMRRLRGRDVFVRAELGGTDPPLLLLHGFPSSSFDWRHLVERLDGRSWAALDFAGFGLSEKPRESNDLRAQADVVEALVAELGLGSVRIVGHDMGTSVANELMARAIEGRLGFDCDAALLFNGSMVIERASLTWEQKVLRSPAGPLLSAVSNRWSLRRGLGAVFSEAHPLTAEEAACQWALLRHRGGHRNLHRLIDYVEQRFEFAERWHGAIRDWPGRLELAWGLRDPVATTAVLDAVRALRPQAPVHELAELGHYPQIEDPARMSRVVTSIL
jgi:pimeloyl-ACP methyl ester carboxylesterase